MGNIIFVNLGDKYILYTGILKISIYRIFIKQNYQINVLQNLFSKIKIIHAKNVIWDPVSGQHDLVIKIYIISTCMLIKLNNFDK